MTSNPPAQPRPPPNVLTGYARQRSMSHLPTVRTFSNRADSGEVSILSDGDERSAKRRRIVSQGASPVSGPELEPMLWEKESAKSPVKKPTGYAPVTWQDAITKQRWKTPSQKPTPEELPPLPNTPWVPGQTADPAPVRARTSCRYRVNIPVPNIPDSLKCSSLAPKLDSKKPADYFPWTGKHAEDVITEQNVKHGYYDRAPNPPERELNTARAPLYSAFKHKSGLESLSALFNLVLERKVKHGALSSTSTFRPPPRVTLTELKRKTWIADLADVEVPLRKLSRTIPQGIRGLSLLEQCLQHNVPINRAVWFVKCVGANEIRTLKRKGVTTNIIAGAEVKWLREWTGNIQQFLDSAMMQCNSEKWMGSIKYCFQLCVRLYQENLLDRDYFLDWIVNKLSSCTLEMLAVWLTLASPFSMDLVRFRKRARLFAGSLLSRFSDLSALGAVQTLLGGRLRDMIRTLVTSRPACFLLPEQWQNLSPSLHACLDFENFAESRLFEGIEYRNRRMLGKDLSRETGKDDANQIYKLLDKASTPFDIDQLSRELGDLCSSYEKLCRSSMIWAVSRFRGGLYRVYLVARLIRRWQRKSPLVEGTILSFFSGDQNNASFDESAYRHLFAELSRSSTFSKSKFLQSLSIHGQGKSANMLQALLQDLCLSSNEEHMANLRSYLLQELVSPADQTSRVQSLLLSIEAAFVQVENLDCGDVGTLVDLKALSELEWSARFQLSAWIRLRVADLADRAAIEIPGKPPLPGSKPFVLGHFTLCRNMLEAVNDIAVLADVLKAFACTKQEVILSALVDTLHLHARSFSAIGALIPLQKVYSQAYVNLRSGRSCILLFATALLDLCQSYPCSITPVRALQQDIIRGDRARALAACSPFSDGVAESLQQAGATFTEDFECILLGEPNMSEQTMTSLFMVLASRITKNDSEGSNQCYFVLCQLLARLRLLRPIQGDGLIRKWLSRVFSTAWSPAHEIIVLELIYTRCINFEGLLDLSNQAPLASRCKTALRDMFASSILSQPSSKFQPHHALAVGVAANRLMNSEPARCLDILLSQNDRGSAFLNTCSMLLPAVLEDEKAMGSLSPIANKSLSMTIDEILGVRSNTADAIRQLVLGVDGLSLTYCSYRIAAYLGTTATSETSGKQEEVAGILWANIKQTAGIESDKAQHPPALLEAVPETIRSRVRNMAEQHVYNILPKFPVNKPIQQPLQFSSEEKTQCLKAVEHMIALGPAVRSELDTSISGDMFEKLTILAKMLNARADGKASAQELTTPTSPVSPAFQSLQAALPLPQVEYRYKDNVLEIVEYLNMLLRVLSMKCGQFSIPLGSTATLSKAAQNEQIKLVALLGSIATQPILGSFLRLGSDESSKLKVRDTVAFALDIAARLSDDLPDESRMLCARILKDRLRDERIMWLVGSMATCHSVNNISGHGLIMMHENKGKIGEFRPKPWEMLESGGGKESDTCLGLGLFGAKRI